MAEEYEIEVQREVTEVDPNTGDLLDYWEVIAKAKPSGAPFSVRVPMAGASPASVAEMLKAKAKMFSDLEAI